MLVLCCLSFTSCAAMSAAQEADEERKECGCEAPPPTYIEVNGFAYGELDLETIENMKLSVPTCDGLTEAGKISGGNISCVELLDDTCSTATGQRVLLKNKEDYTALPVAAKFDKITYAHPNPDYPNLLVVRIDGEPGIFKFYCCAKDKKCSIDAVLRDIYGVTAPEKIQAVRIAYISAPAAGFVEATITDRAELEAFFDAIGELSGSGENPTYNDSSPWYDCVIELENGFSCSLSFDTKSKKIVFAGMEFESNEALAAWLERNAKR